VSDPPSAEMIALRIQGAFASDRPTAAEVERAMRVSVPPTVEEVRGTVAAISGSAVLDSLLGWASRLEGCTSGTRREVFRHWRQSLDRLRSRQVIAVDPRMARVWPLVDCWARTSSATSR
jgi:hypothetical protein